MTAPFAQELSCRYHTALLDVVQHDVDPEELNRFLAGWDLTVADLRTQTNWVSMKFTQALMDFFCERIGTSALATRFALHVHSPKVLGFVYPLLRTVGSPRLAYASLAQLGGQLNKVSRVVVRDVRPGYAVAEYHPVRADLQETSPNVCALRRQELVMTPLVWGLPPARLVEQACQAKGDAACIYEIRWAERPAVLVTAAGLALGALAGALTDAGWWTVCLAACGLLVGRLWDSRRHVQRLHQFNEEQNVALRLAAQDSEQRFRELAQAKAEVEQKVEERTSELNATTQRLEVSLKQLEELSRVKDEFLANVSHELRTPLTLILAPLEEMLRDGDLSAQSADYLRAMHRAASRLQGMVNDLLELARLQAGQLRLSISDADLVDLCTATLEPFRSLAGRRGVQLHLDLPASHDVISVDAGRMEFVLTNLLSNALKFTPSGGSITLRLKESEDQCVVEVEDTGVGISSEQQAHAFERFARFDNPLAPKAAGAGIGLAMVKGIVELHGGTVGLRSQPGKGTTVTVTLRRGKDHFADNVLERRQVDVPVPFGRRADDQSLMQSGTDHQEAEWSTRPDAPEDAPLVLVVEDNEDLRAFLCRVMSKRYRVIEAPDGALGLQMARDHQPMAILSDVTMPVMDGFEMCRRLKEDPATRPIPVVLITARRGADRVLEGFEVGADDYLIKPFNAQELMARMDVHLRLRRLTTERVHSEKLVLMGTLASGMAHEVRNPAGAILAGLPRVRKDMVAAGTPERALRMVDTAIECAERISQLVGDLLELGQPDRDNVRSWDLHEGLRATLRVLEHRAMAVQFHEDFAFTGSVMARPAAINQVFLNLVDNAVRAAGDKGRVKISTAAERGGVAVTVTDSGPGIAADVAPRLFDPFFTTKAPGSGTGLGLHIARRVAQEHGGTLELASPPGQPGACFKLWLPVQHPGVSSRATHAPPVNQ